MKIHQMRFKKIIAVVADTHVGSPYAVFPEKYRIEDLKTVYKLNDGQKELLDYWTLFNKTCDNLKVDTVFLLGDIVHGQNVKERGVRIITTDLNEQANAAYKLLFPLVNGRKSYWIAGSRYHRSAEGYNPDQSICEKFKNSQWLGEVANLRIGSKIINISHGGSSAFIYRETAMAREIVFSKMAWANNKLPQIDMFIHGHWHWFAHLHEYGVHHVQVPCWMVYEPAPIFTKNYTRFQPDIGGVIVLLDQDDRITVWHFIYPLPHIADGVIDI